MTIRVYRGDNVNGAKQYRAEPTNPEAGDRYRLGVNDKFVEYIAQQASVSDVVQGLVEAWNASTVPEHREVIADDEGDHLTLTAATPGVDFVLAAEALDSGGFQVEVETITQGVPNRNEKQQVRLPSATSGGAFVLNFAGQPTAAINWNAPTTGLGSLEEALLALPNINPGDVVVTGSPGLWVVEFTGQYSGVNVPLLSGDGTNLTGAATITVQTTQDGAGVLNQIYETTIGPGNFSSSVHNWRATVDGIDGDTRFVFPTADTIRAAIEDRVGAGNVTVEFLGGNVDDANNPATYRVEFIGAWGGRAVDYQITLASASFSTTTTEIQAGNSTGPNEVQTITINDGPTSGTWDTTFEGQTTGALAFGIDAAGLESALQGLPNVGVGNAVVTKTGTLPVTYTVTFQGALASKDVQQMTANPSGLGGGNVYCDTVQAAVQGKDEAQRISFSQQPSAGTWDLTINLGAGNETASAIPYDASAAILTTALESLPTPVPGDFEVSGDTGGPWVVVFRQNLARTDVNEFTGDGSNLSGSGSQGITLTVLTESSGANHWDDPLNWIDPDTGEPGIPESEDIAVLQDGSEGPLYGIKQRASFTVDAGTDTLTLETGRRTFSDGLKVRVRNIGGALPGGLVAGTNYFVVNSTADGQLQLSLTEGGAPVDITTAGSGTNLVGVHLTKLLVNSRFTGAVGLPSRNELGYVEYRPVDLEIDVDEVVIGDGEGQGSPRINLDLGTADVEVLQSGASVEVPAVLLQGMLTLFVLEGDVGVCFRAGEAATVPSLIIRGGQVSLGDVTVQKLDWTGGSLRAPKAVFNADVRIRA